MKSADMWYGTLGMALIVVFFGIAGFIAYLLYGPPIPYWPLGNPVQATSSDTTLVPDVPNQDLSGEEGVLFACEGGRSLKAAFVASGVRLALSDGRHINLPQVVSSSGARFANPDESFVFWNTGTTAFITENGSATYSGCIVAGM